MAAKFPLWKHPNGQWCKKIKGGRDGRSTPYYFGAIAEDPTGERAVEEYYRRMPGIRDGTDHLRVQAEVRDRVTLGAVVAAYLKARRSDVRAGELSLVMWGDYARVLRDVLVHLGPSTPVASLRPQHFAAYHEHLIADRQLKARARRRIIAMVRAMFGWADDEGLCDTPKFGRGFKAPSVTKESIRKEKMRRGEADHSDRIATGQEIDALLAVSQPNMRAMILLGANCGFGPADLGSLRWCHLDLGAGFVSYPRRKTGVMRRVYLWKRTRAALRKVRTLRRTAAAIRRDGDQALVFVTRKGQAYYRERERIVEGKVVGVTTFNAISGTFGRMARKLGLEGLTFNRLRHTMKTLGKQARDRDAVNLCMGHAVNTIEAVYDHERIGDDRVRRVALAVKRGLWPTPRRGSGPARQPALRLAGGDEVEAA